MPVSVDEALLRRLREIYELIPFRGNFFIFDNEEMLPRQEKRIWDNQNFHYDNVATAMLTLFAVQTGEGWPQ
jgi:hypothetical protein